MIRQATKDDILDILVVCKQFARETKQPAKFDAKHFANSLGNLISLDHGLVLLSIEDDEVVGILIAVASQFVFSPQMVATEMGWYVLPEYRDYRRGVKLVQAFEAWAKEIGADFIAMSDIVQTQDLSKLYERQGYKLSEKTYVKELK